MRPARAVHVLQGAARDRPARAHHRHRGLLLRQDLAGLRAGVHRRAAAAVDGPRVGPDPGQLAAVLPAGEHARGS
ncbi:hypothetical protein O3G_MSEX014025 [Manduca sexta]|uniref:Uncharacterized protein n=1 Tax=Manduca sexta TaxID=7130 RepID=A0A921ZVF4_MANSE|nr:hypothetical protein O3G_MSEX014025 [Manduca sexta]